MKSKETIVILDFYSQFNQLIARRVRECNVYSEVLPYDTPIEKIKEIIPKVLYLLVALQVFMKKIHLHVTKKYSTLVFQF